MSIAAGRVVASIQYSTTSEPVMFVVESERVEQVLQVLPDDLQTMYFRAWRDAVSAVMDDFGWTYEAPQITPALKVERIRTGRPRVIHRGHIQTQLAGAVKAVDDALDASVAHDTELAVSVAGARSSQPVAFEWRVTESTMELLGSSYIDLTTKPVFTSS